MDNKEITGPSQVAGGVIVGEDNRIIIVSQKNSWSLPKGHIEAGETIFDAATREIKEETGITTDDLIFIRSLGSYTRNKISEDGKNEEPDTLRELHMFLFSTTYDKPLTPVDSDNPEARWVTGEEATTLLTHPKDREFIKNIVLPLI